MKTYMFMVDFYGVHVGKYTSPMDCLGFGTKPAEKTYAELQIWHHILICSKKLQTFTAHSCQEEACYEMTLASASNGMKTTKSIE